MTALNQLAARLRLNAASMEHGEAERDIRAAADILDSFADVGEIEYLVLPRRIAQTFSKAYVRASERMEKSC